MTTPAHAPLCINCGTPYSPARLDELGYLHCSAPLCVDLWRRGKLDQYRLDLIPKVGFGISFRDDPVAVTMGRSSGRTV